MSTATATAPTTEICPSLSETDTKADIMQHLRDFHRLPSWGVNTRSTKADLLGYHSRVHEQIDNHEANGVSRESMERRYLQITHTHMSVLDSTTSTDPDPLGTLTDQAKAAVPDPGSLANLDTRTRNALLSIVKSDYDVLLSQVDQAAQAFRIQRTAEVEAEYRGRLSALTEAQTKLNAVANKAQAQMNAELDKVLAKGFTTGRGYRARFEVTIPALHVQGRDEALQRIQRETEEAVRRARNIITIQRNAATRAILLATVSPEVAKVAQASIPSIEGVMSAAQEQAQLAIAAAPSDHPYYDA